MPVRIEARLGVHTEFVQKQLSTRRPRSAIASMCGVCVTTDPYALMAWLAWSSDRISRMLGRRAVMVLLEAGRRPQAGVPPERGDRKSTRLNSSHVAISYAVFCLKKKKETGTTDDSAW